MRGKLLRAATEYPELQSRSAGGSWVAWERGILQHIVSWPTLQLPQTSLPPLRSFSWAGRECAYQKIQAGSPSAESSNRVRCRAWSYRTGNRHSEPECGATRSNRLRPFERVEPNACMHRASHNAGNGRAGSYAVRAHCRENESTSRRRNHLWHEERCDRCCGDKLNQPVCRVIPWKPNARLEVSLRDDRFWGRDVRS